MKTAILTFIMWFLSCVVPGAEQKTSIHDTLAELAGPFHVYNKALARTEISYELNLKKPMSLGYVLHAVTTNYLGFQRFYPDWPRQVSYDLYPRKPLSSDYGLFYSVSNQQSLPGVR